MADSQGKYSPVPADFAVPARARAAILLLVSVVFYTLCEPLYIIQLLLATICVFFVALQIDVATGARRKTLLKLGILLALSNLFAFKYASFINENVRFGFSLLHLHYPIPPFDIVLPIGISFYTLQLIAYIVDVYRGERPERSFVIFALFVTYLPKLIAGPIERARHLLPQLHACAVADRQQVMHGIQLVLWGAFKKLVIADRFAPFVDRVYDSPHLHDGVSFTIATWMYAFQIYCDFSGYADMARGAAGVLGVRLTSNFDRPYFATSVKDFWKRWHVSLSSWLTDYVYTPFIRQRLFGISFFNLMLVGVMITFISSGLWHGAQWKFVAWGALHGAYMVGYVLLQRPSRLLTERLGIQSGSRAIVALKVMLTFNLVCIAYVLFRAASLQDGGYILSHLFDGWSNAGATILSIVAEGGIQLALATGGASLVLIVEAMPSERARTFGSLVLVRWLCIGLCAATVILVTLLYGADRPFIYSRF